MKLTETRLASTDHEAVIEDVKTLFPEWNEGRQTLRLDAEKNIVPFEESEDGLIQVGESPSGYRIDIVPIGDRVTKQAEYDEEGELISEAEYAGERRIDIIAPNFYDMPEFATEVNPSNPDSKYSV